MKCPSVAQERPTPAASQPVSGKQHLAGKTCVLTGATSGIGRQVAHELADGGADLIIICRDPQRGEKLVSELRSETHNERVRLLVADFARQQEMHRVAAELAAATPHVDCLINNVGAVFSHGQLTEDGVEAQFAVNYLNPFLFTGLVLPLLSAAVETHGAARIVNVSSRGHLSGELDFDSIEQVKGYFSLKAYRQSKLAVTLWTFELARRLAGSGITANCLCPGFVRTGIGTKHSDGITAVAWGLFRLFLAGPEQAAERVLSLCGGEDLQEVSGEYFSDGEIAPCNPLARDNELAARLWKTSERLTGFEYPLPRRVPR